MQNVSYPTRIWLIFHFQVNPSVFLNPRVLQAMMQIQQATQVIIQEAPEVTFEYFN